MRPLAFVAPLVVLVTVLPAAPAESTPCEVPAFIAGYTLVNAPAEHWLRVSFHVDAPLSGTFWSGVGWHASTTAMTGPLYYGYAAERAGAFGFLEDARGALVQAPGGFLMYPYGIELSASGPDVSGFDVRVTEQDHEACGAAAAGSDFTLAPGDYTFTVLAASDLGNGGAAFLPTSVDITRVETGVSYTLREPNYSCLVNADAMALGFTSAALVGCSSPYDTHGRTYRALMTGRFRDAAHDVRWRPPSGPEITFPFFDAGVGEAGVWTLSIPRYVTPLGQPLGLPIGTPGAVNSDSGVFGVLADVR